MNEIAVNAQNNLPASFEDLTKFVLIGREKLVAVRAEIRAIKKVGLAEAVRRQKMSEAQAISEAVLDAEVRIGELMQAIPKATTNHKNKDLEIDSGVDFLKSKSEPEELELEDKVKDAEAEEIQAADNSRTSQAEAEVEDNNDKPKTKSEIIKEAGFTQKQVERFQQLAAHPEAVAQAKAEAKANDDIVSRSLVLNMIKEQKRAEREEQRENMRQENTEKIEKLATPLDAVGLFQTIVIDPPWDWGDEGDADQFGRARPDYQTMSIQEIAQLPVAKIADENCHLYLWVTNRSLPKAFGLLDAWGFRYITCLTWVKPSFGMGNYFRGSTEQVLFGVKGSQPLKRRDVGTHFEAPRGDRHSAKPEEFYKLVESCSYPPYIDIFGRSKRSGWAVWGENG
ncbi:MAG: hypothetical protein IJ667_07400 [Synergistaceae bacterium]|nr:hypothetical protein [Synergistaceae bacterium]